jgi:hypothetical protein
MAKDTPIFETHDVDLAAFLMLEGLKFIECCIDPTLSGVKPRVLVRFFDEKGKARDLERVFMSSLHHKYRLHHKYLLKEIHRTIKGM